MSIALKKQELFKGCALWYGVNAATFSGAEIEGGWGISARYAANPLAYISLSGFNAFYFKDYTREDLVTSPLFTSFEDGRMASTNALVFSDVALRAKMHGDAIPAESFAAGRNVTRGVSANINLQVCASENWPKTDDDKNPIWEHSDIKNVVFFYLYKLFRGFVGENQKMKIKLPLHVCMCLLYVNAYADTVKLSALVLDSLSAEPIQDASVTFSFKEDVGIRIWTESAKHHRKSKKTDRQGRCYMTGNSNCGRAGCYVENPPEGYYAPAIGWKHRFQRKSILGNWQPDNLVATIRLQRVEHPIPLMVKQVEWRNWRQGLLGLQGTNAVLRLDMVKGDWLPPYGHGETSDLEITSELKITGKERRFLRATASEGDVLFYDLVQTIRPTGMDDCISELQSDPTSGIKIRHGSDMGRGARVVRHQGMHKRIERTGNWECQYFDDTDENRCYTFRIRSRYDERGNLAEACYGKIYGDFKFEGHLDRGIISVRFLYYLNPTPLDRNLEWDMKSNLCPDSGNLGERRP